MSVLDRPDYMAGFIHMDKDWLSNQTSSFDLGWIDGLFKVANKSVDQLFGTYDYQLNEEDLLDLEDLENFAEKGKGAIIYASIWIAAVAIFTIAGIIWCLCNKCICCCRSSFKGRGDSEIDDLENTDPHFALRPRYSERKSSKSGKPSTGAIVVSVAMSIWLLSLMLMILHTFGANEKTNEAIDQIQPDLDNALKDIIKYLGTTVKQLEYTFIRSFETFTTKVDNTLNECSGAKCYDLKTNVEQRLRGSEDGFEESLRTDLDELIKSLKDFEQEANDAKAELDENFEAILTDVNNGLYWLFMLFNLLYLAVFVLVLLGTILAVFAKQSGFKTAGYLLIRVAIVLIFVLGIFIVGQLVLLFISGGLISEVICPAVRNLENEPTSGGGGFQNGGGGYEIPNIGQIIRGCKKDQTAYTTFELDQVFKFSELNEIIEKFDPTNLLPPNNPSIMATGDVSFLLNNRTNSHINQDELGTAEEVQRQVVYYTEFIQDAVTNEVGKCKPTYNAMNATINLFCYKVAAPLISFWWILQFIAVVFVLIIVTAMLFERLHF